MTPQIIPMSHPNKISNIIWDSDLSAPAPYKINANHAVSSDNATHAVSSDNATHAYKSDYAVIASKSSYVDENPTDSIYTIPYTQTTSTIDFLNNWSAEKLIGTKICEYNGINVYYNENTRRKLTMTIGGAGTMPVNNHLIATLRDGTKVTIFNITFPPGGTFTYIEDWHNPIVNLTGSCWYNTSVYNYATNNLTCYVHINNL